MSHKVKVLFYLSESLNKKLRELIASKYQTFERGMLSNEVEDALTYWIGMHTKAQKELVQNHINPTPKVARVFMDIKQYLLTNHYDALKCGMTVPKHHLEEAIGNVRGNDKRTILKWLQAFVKMKLVKPITASMWEIV